MRTTSGCSAARPSTRAASRTASACRRRPSASCTRRRHQTPRPRTGGHRHRRRCRCRWDRLPRSLQHRRCRVDASHSVAPLGEIAGDAPSPTPDLQGRTTGRWDDFVEEGVAVVPAASWPVGGPTRSSSRPRSVFGRCHRARVRNRTEARARGGAGLTSFICGAGRRGSGIGLGLAHAPAHDDERAPSRSAPTTATIGHGPPKVPASRRSWAKPRMPRGCARPADPLRQRMAARRGETPDGDHGRAGEGAAVLRREREAARELGRERPRSAGVRWAAVPAQAEPVWRHDERRRGAS